jgi:hypothetical protein
MDEADEAIEAVEDGNLRGLIADLHENVDASLRLAFRYEGEAYDIVHVSDTVDAQYTDDELGERVKTLLMKALGDPPQEQALYDFGELNSTVRFFDEVIVATFPDEEWSGVVVVFDREESPLVDTTLDYLQVDD